MDPVTLNLILSWLLPVLGGVVLPVLHSRGYKLPILSAIFDLFMKKPLPVPAPSVPPSPDAPVQPDSHPILSRILDELRKRLPIPADNAPPIEAVHGADGTLTIKGLPAPK